MRDIYIYQRGADGSLTLKGVTDRIKSLRWTRRFFTSDSFDAVFPASEHNLALLTKESVIELPERCAGFITSLKTESSAEGTVISVSGRSLAGVLARRVLVNGDASDSFMTILEKNAGASAEPAQRRIPGIVFDKTADCPSAFAAMLKYESLGKYAEEAGKLRGFGVSGKIVRADEPYVLFSGRFGINRTAGQTEHAPVIFSEMYDNIRSLSRSYSSEGAMTNAVVWSPATVSGKTVIPMWHVFCGAYSGWDSVEKAFEIPPQIRNFDINVNGESFGSVGTDVPASRTAADEIQSVMYSGCREKLSISLVIDDSYLERFDAGDTVTVRSRFLNMTQNMTISEITERYENGGFSASAVLEIIRN